MFLKEKMEKKKAVLKRA